MFKPGRKRRLLLLRGPDHDVVPLQLAQPEASPFEPAPIDVSHVDETEPERPLEEIVEAFPVPAANTGFLAACGSAEGSRILLRDGTSESSHPLSRPFVVIGRNADCDIHLEHPSVAYRHAYLQVVGGRLLCIGLSRGAGHSATPFGWVDPGVSTRIGPWAMSWRPGDAEVEPQDTEDRLPDIRLTAETDDDLPFEFEVRERVVLLGRDPRCRMRLNDPSVSAFHASVVLTPSGPWIVDLAGRGGIWVNGEPVSFAPLVEGDEIRIGCFRIDTSEEGTLDAADLPVVHGREMPIASGTNGTNGRYGAPRRTSDSSVVMRSVAELEETARSVAAAHEPSPAPMAPSPVAPSPSPVSPDVPREVATSPPQDMVPVSVVELLTDRFAGMQRSYLAHSERRHEELLQAIAASYAGMHDLIREACARMEAINGELHQLYAVAMDQQATSTARSLTDGRDPVLEGHWGQSVFDEGLDLDDPEANTPDDVGQAEAVHAGVHDGTAEPDHVAPDTVNAEATAPEARADEPLPMPGEFTPDTSPAKIFKRIRQLESERKGIWARIGELFGGDGQ